MPSAPRTLTHVDSGDVRLQVWTEGSGPLVVLVHGWPETSWSWRHQVPALVQAGFQVAVPDLRGYGGSECPEAVEARSGPRR